MIYEQNMYVRVCVVFISLDEIKWFSLVLEIVCNKVITCNGTNSIISRQVNDRVVPII